MSTSTEKNHRAMLASRRILSAAGEPRPVDLVEAATLVPTGDLQGRQRMIAAAADLLAAADDPTAEVRAISAAFFRRPPMTPVTGGPRPGDDRRPAPAPAPASLWAEAGLRDFADIDVAGQVVAQATLRRAALRDACMGCALDLRLLGCDPAAGVMVAELGKLADKLRDHAAAAGSSPPPPARVAMQREADRAVARGAGALELEAMRRFEREYDVLNDTGHRVSMTRARYVEINMQRWKQDHQ